MSNYEFNVESEKIRESCDSMSIQQLKDLLQLLEYDLQERRDKRDLACAKDPF